MVSLPKIQATKAGEITGLNKLAAGGLALPKIGRYNQENQNPNVIYMSRGEAYTK